MSDLPRPPESAPSSFTKADWARRKQLLDLRFKRPLTPEEEGELSELSRRFWATIAASQKTLTEAAEAAAEGFRKLADAVAALDAEAKG